MCVNNDSNTTTYTCIINDAQGCYDTISYVLSQPEELLVSTTLVEPIDCFGANTGRVRADVLVVIIHLHTHINGIMV